MLGAKQRYHEAGSREGRGVTVPAGVSPLMVRCQGVWPVPVTESFQGRMSRVSYPGAGTRRGLLSICLALFPSPTRPLLETFPLRAAQRSKSLPSIPSALCPAHPCPPALLSVNKLSRLYFPAPAPRFMSSPTKPSDNCQLIVTTSPSLGCTMFLALAPRGAPGPDSAHFCPPRCSEKALR